MQSEKDDQGNIDSRERQSRFAQNAHPILNVKEVATYTLGKTRTQVPSASERTACPFPDRSNEAKQQLGSQKKIHRRSHSLQTLRILRPANDNYKPMPVKAHSKDEPKSLQSVRKGISILEHRQGRQNLVVLVNVSNDLAAVCISVATSPGWYCNHRRCRSTQLIGFTKAALPPRCPLSIMKVKKKRRCSLNVILRRG